MLTLHSFLSILSEFKILNHRTLSLHSLLSLEELLSGIENLEADSFILYPEMIQQAFLEKLLGESAKLIESIIQSIKQVSQIPTGQTCVEYCSIIICSHSLKELTEATKCR